MKEKLSFLFAKKFWPVWGMALVLAVSGTLTGQAFIRMLPLFVSLVVNFFIARVSRYAPMIGGFNSILYAAVYYYYGLYASALYALLFSFPLQLITFLRWKKHAYGESSVMLRRMTGKQRVLLALGSLAVWGLCYWVLSLTDASYPLLDLTTSLLGILISFLTMLAYVEYTFLNIPSALVGIVLYVTMLRDQPQQLPYLLFSLYSFVCVCLAVKKARALYREQQALEQEESRQQEG